MNETMTPLQRMRGRASAWVDRCVTRRVLVVWAAILVATVAYAYVRVELWNLFSLPPVRGVAVDPLTLGVAGLLAGWAWLSVESDALLLSTLAAGLLGFSVLSVALGCPGMMCEGPEVLRVGLRWTLAGPTVFVTDDPCGIGVCAHRVQLVPLALGLLLVADALAE